MHGTLNERVIQAPGSALPKDPQGAKTGSIGRLNSKPTLKPGCHQPTLVPCQPMYVIRPAHFDLPKVDLLTTSTAEQNMLILQPNVKSSLTDLVT
jgi:hypothetical protein